MVNVLRKGMAKLFCLTLIKFIISSKNYTESWWLIKCLVNWSEPTHLWQGSAARQSAKAWRGSAVTHRNQWCLIRKTILANQGPVFVWATI